MTPVIEQPVHGVDDDGPRRQLERVWRHKPGLVGWLSVTTHQAIGKRYIITAFLFLLAGSESKITRFQLPGDFFEALTSSLVDRGRQRRHDVAALEFGRDGSHPIKRA